MDLGGGSGGSSRKGPRRAHSNRGGHRPGRIINTPREKDPVKTPINIFRYNKNGYSSPSGDGSESSRFSTGHNTGDERDDRGRQQNQKEKQKRQHTSDQLAESQRQRGSERECINIDDDNEGTATSNSFDGVRTDIIINPKNENYITSVKEQFVGNDDNVKTRQRSKNFRGNNHEKSSMARSLSPKEGRSQRSQRGQRAEYNYASLGGVGRASASQSNDPLDVALEQQTNRPMSSTKSHLHDKFASNKKVFEDVECSPQAARKRGKGGSMTEAMGGVVKEYQGVINNLWGKGRTKSKQHGAVNRLDLWPKGKANSKQQYGNADMASNRQRRKKGNECAEAAHQRKDQPMERERGNPWSGEKRKSEHTEWQEDGHLYKKTQLSPKGSQQNAIDVDGSQTKLGQIIHSVDSCSPRKGSNDEEADVLAAIKESEMHVDQEDYAHLNTPKSDKGSGLWDRENTKTTMKGMANLGLTKKPGDNGSKGQNSSGKKKVINMHKFLQGTKKNDNIVSSPNSKSGLRDRESSPMANNLGQRIPKKAGGVYGKGGDTKSARTKMIRQGQVLDDDGDNPSWFGRLTKQNTQKANKKAGTKNRRQSKISLAPKTNGNQRRTRSSSRTRNSSKSGGSNNDIITIDSSSDEDEASIGVSDEEVNVEEVNIEESVAEGRGRRRRSPGDRASIDAVRIAVGKKVFNRKCELSLQFGTNNPYLLFSFYDEGKKSEHSVYLRDDELKEVKYFIARDDENEGSAADDTVESMTVIAFRITPTDKNNFTKYSRSYNQEDTEDEEKNERRYISVEVRDTDEFQAMLDQMRQHRTLAVWCSGDSEIPFNDLAKYTQALQEDNRKEREKRLVSVRRTRSGGNKKKKDSDNELLLVYPFDVDEAILSEAASELKELGGDSLGVESVHAEMHDPSVGGDGSDDKGKSSTRTHYVTIRQDDKERLCPGQFLNDSLVDFWMRWISRGESQLQDSNVHFFTSHFMTTLKDDGPEAVSSWTSKKKIDMFKKKLIFVPVNADLHWSLCVIVNPGLIANSYDEDISENEEHSCILFLDSLKMHSKKAYARHIRIWLNFEWKRLGKGKIDGKGAPFETGKMNLRSPKIPYQENGCDCGVFVCRYAYNLYMMRHLKFTWVDICEKPGLKSLITKGPAFQFDMSDIARIREEMGTLIDNLSKLYLRMKEQEKANKRAKRREIESSKAGKGDASSENASEEATRPASGKEDARSETTTTASDEDGGTAEGSMTGAAVGKDEDGDVTMSSFEEKENMSQGNNVHEVAAPEKLASTRKESSGSDILELEQITSPDL